MEKKAEYEVIIKCYLDAKKEAKIEAPK